MTNRLIKNEVIDIADRLEEMHSLMMKQSKKIKFLKRQVKDYYNTPPEIGYSIDEGEEIYDGEREDVYTPPQTNSNNQSAISAQLKQPHL